MPYAVIEPSSCGTHKGRAKLRLDFFLNPDDPNYDKYPGNPFHSHFIYPDKDASDADIKAEIEKCLNYFYAFHQHCWDKKVNFIDEWKKVPSQAGQVRCPFIKGKPKDLKANEGKVQNVLSRVQEFQVGVSKIPPQDLRITDKGTIDVGSPAVDRADYASENITYVTKENPANASGTIDTIEAWFDYSVTDLEVGTFIHEGSNYLSTRDSHYIGSVVAGAKRTYSGLSIDIETGDYIGYSHGYGGHLARDTSGGSAGYWFKAGDSIPCSSVLFTNSANPYLYSLYGTGTETLETLELSLTDGLKVGDTLARNMTASVSRTDGIKTGDIFSQLSTMSPTLSDGLKLGDSLLAAVTFWLSLTEGINLGDTLIRTMEAFPTLTDGIKLSEAFDVSNTADLSLADGVTFGDALAVLYKIQFTLSDGIIFSDTNLAELETGIIYLTLRDGLNLGDSPLAEMLANLELSDGKIGRAHV